MKKVKPIYVNEETHLQLKIMSAKRQTSIKEIIEEMIKDTEWKKLIKEKKEEQE